MAELVLRDPSTLTIQLTNDLALVRQAHLEVFTTRTVFDEDPGLNYTFRVKEQLSKYLPPINPEMDSELYNNEMFLDRSARRKPLPVDRVKDKVLHAINNSQNVIIGGGTGCGKSTQVPQLILRERILAKQGSSCRIICTQPRRVAASSIARRVATELGEELGQSVGYAIRGDVVQCRKEGATITYCTSGVLVRKLIADPALLGISHVIVDEIHERSLELELLIHFLKELAKLRRDLKLILMSATMHTDKYRGYLDGCEVVEIPPSMHDVKTHFLEDMPRFLRTPVSVVEMDKKRIFVIMLLVEWIAKQREEGAILIFVPGWRDMKDLDEACYEFNDRQTDSRCELKVRLLHSRVMLEDRKIFDPIQGPGRKVLISTTIAESSITVPDVRFVIDLGKTMVNAWYDDHNTTAVREEFITKASAEQRRGRAGRVANGYCFRLYSSQQYEGFRAHSDPEKGNQNVGSAILNVLSLGESVTIFDKFINRPRRNHLNNELASLRQYNMISENNHLTLLGRRVNELSADPLVAKMLIFGGVFGCGEEVALVAAGLANTRLFPMPQGHWDVKKNRKKNRGYQPPTRSELIGQLSLSHTSDALSIVGAIKKFSETNDKLGFCRAFLLDQRTIEDVLSLSETVKQEMEKMKGSRQTEMNVQCVQNIIAGSFLPNLAHTKYTPKAHSNKFYVQGSDFRGFYNAPQDSVLNKKNPGCNKVFTFNSASGIPPKLNLDFLNQISPEALIIFAATCKLITSTLIEADGKRIRGTANYIEFLINLRTAFQGMLYKHLTLPEDISVHDVKGQILGIIRRLFSE